MKWKKLLTIASVILFLFLLAGVGKAYMDGRFESAETFQEYIKGFGLFAPIVLIVLQALQVIFPILPGFLGCAVGAVLFGSMGGFWCNYIGISVGSILAFLLAKKYGVKVIGLAGATTEDAVKCNEEGIDAYFSIVNRAMTIEEAMDKATASENMTATTTQIFNLITSIQQSKNM